MIGVKIVGGGEGGEGEEIVGVGVKIAVVGLIVGIGEEVVVGIVVIVVLLMIIQLVDRMVVLTLSGSPIWVLMMLIPEALIGEG